MTEKQNNSSDAPKEEDSNPKKEIETLSQTSGTGIPLSEKEQRFLSQHTQGLKRTPTKPTWEEFEKEEAKKSGEEDSACSEEE